MKSAFCAESHPGYARKSALAVTQTARAPAATAMAVSTGFQRRVARAVTADPASGPAVPIAVGRSAVEPGSWVTTPRIRRQNRAARALDEESHRRAVTCI